MKFLEDLRFFIGSFFLILGVVLLSQAFINPVLTDGYNLNLITGICFVIFSFGALALSWREVRQVSAKK